VSEQAGAKFAVAGGKVVERSAAVSGSGELRAGVGVERNSVTGGCLGDQRRIADAS
jgi:hypothetical protein